MNIEEARTNMLKQQFRGWNVLNDSVLDLLETTPRENFVPSDFRRQAFADMSIPLEHNQFMLLPSYEARIIEAVNVQSHEKVLEIGTGSGYMTALLAKQAKKVVSVDIFADFTKQAHENLQKLDITNVDLETGDAHKGWANHAPFDVIVMTGSQPILPHELPKQLNPGGRLFAFIGDSPSMKALLINKLPRNEWSTQNLFETDVPPLLNITPSTTFDF